MFGKVVRAEYEYPRQGYTAHRDFAPRVGLAYLLTPKTRCESLRKILRRHVNNNFSATAARDSTFQSKERGSDCGFRAASSTFGARKLPSPFTNRNSTAECQFLPLPSGFPLNYYPTGAVSSGP